MSHFDSELSEEKTIYEAENIAENKPFARRFCLKTLVNNTRILFNQELKAKKLSLVFKESSKGEKIRGSVALQEAIIDLLYQLINLSKTGNDILLDCEYETNFILKTNVCNLIITLRSENITEKQAFLDFVKSKQHILQPERDLDTKMKVRVSVAHTSIRLQVQDLNLSSNSNLLKFKLVDFPLNTNSSHYGWPKIDFFKPTILIVGILPTRLFGIRQMLETHYNIISVATAEDGLNAVLKTDVDIVLCCETIQGLIFSDCLKSDNDTGHIIVIMILREANLKFYYTSYTGADVLLPQCINPFLLKKRIGDLLDLKKNIIRKIKKDHVIIQSSSGPKSSGQTFINKAIFLVEHNMVNPEFTIQSFAHEMGMSRSSLYRKLKKITGMSISTFIKSIKLKRATSLIVKSEMNISEIAFSLGFNDLKNFRKSFKKIYGVAPSKYRSLKF